MSSREKLARVIMNHPWMKANGSPYLGECPCGKKMSGGHNSPSHADHLADAILAAGYRQPRTIGYVVVGNQNNALDWDDQLYGTVDSAIGSLCSPYQPFDRDPESPNFWGKEYRICPVSELAVAS